MHGPPNSPYEKYSFRLEYIPGPSYPYKPPKLTFKDPVWNPFVDFKSGKICCDILQEKWSPALG
ncbi:UNVERIFIED_CONTAM: hypothetical protein GTU68_041141 [Idotea baltica]|nr:hypothetical protein [Idotea baltica]